MYVGYCHGYDKGTIEYIIVVMIDAKREKYRFLSVLITARPLLSVETIVCSPKKGPFNMKLEGQIKTQAEKNGGKSWRV